MLIGRQRRSAGRSNPTRAPARRQRGATRGITDTAVDGRERFAKEWPQRGVAQNLPWRRGSPALPPPGTQAGINHCCASDSKFNHPATATNETRPSTKATVGGRHTLDVQSRSETTGMRDTVRASGVRDGGWSAALQVRHPAKPAAHGMQQEKGRATAATASDGPVGGRKEWSTRAWRQALAAAMDDARRAARARSSPCSDKRARASAASARRSRDHQRRDRDRWRSRPERRKPRRTRARCRVPPRTPLLPRSGGHASWLRHTGHISTLNRVTKSKRCRRNRSGDARTLPLRRGGVASVKTAPRATPTSGFQDPPPHRGLEAHHELLHPRGLLRLEGLLCRALRNAFLRLLRLPRFVGLPHGLQPRVERLRKAAHNIESESSRTCAHRRAPARVLSAGALRRDDEARWPGLCTLSGDAAPLATH